MINALQHWVSEKSSALKREGISLDLSKASKGLLKNGISLIMRSDRFEATIELWETGESEFYFLDWAASDRDPKAGVEVTHHDFVRPGELYAALETLVSRMSPVLTAR